MNPIASPLNIIDFAIMNFEFKFVPPATVGMFDFREEFKTYELDIDFSIHSGDIIQVFMKTEINRGEIVKPGYSIFAEVACLFEFNKDITITEEARNAIEGFSTIYIALNSLRGFIQQITSTGPVGRYMLPSVDLNDMVAKKKAALEIDNQSKTKKKRPKTKEN